MHYFEVFTNFYSNLPIIGSAISPIFDIFGKVLFSS